MLFFMLLLTERAKKIEKERIKNFREKKLGMDRLLRGFSERNIAVRIVSVSIIRERDAGSNLCRIWKSGGSERHRP